MPLKLTEIPVLNKIIDLLKCLKVPYLYEVSLYELLYLYIAGLKDGILAFRAAAVSYSLFMALFPFLLFLLSLFEQFPFSKELLDVLRDVVIENMLSFEMLKQIDSQILTDQITIDNNNINRDGGSMPIKIIPFLLSIFFASSGIGAIFSSFKESTIYKEIYNDSDTGGILKHYAKSLLLTLTLSSFLIGLLLIIVWINHYLGRIVEVEGHFTNYTNNIIDTVTLISLAIYSFICLYMIYKMGTPSKKGYPKIIIPGCILTFILFIVTTWLFKYYVGEIATQNILYGSIGTVLLVLFWMYISVIVLLTGFEFNMTLTAHKIQIIKRDDDNSPLQKTFIHRVKERLNKKNI